MNKFGPALLLTVIFVAQDFAQTTFANYKAALDAGHTAFAAKKYDDSLAAYKAATELGKTDAEKAAALIGTGDSYQKVKITRITHVGKTERPETVEGDQAAAASNYEKVLLLKDPPVENVVKAHFGLAEVLGKQSQADRQRAELDKVIAMPNASGDQKAEAYILRAKTSYPILTGGYKSQRDDLMKATLVAGASDEKKAEALFRLGESTSNNTEFPLAVGYFTAVTKLKNATNVQKISAYLKLANYHGSSKNFNEVRAIAAKILALPGIKPEQKADAYQMAAKGHFLENDLPGGEAELAKISAIKGIDPKDQAAIHQENGDVLFQYKSYARARVEYEKTLKVLTDPKSYIVGDLNNKIAKAYFEEKNYKKAKETINGLLANANVDAWRKQAASLLLGEIYLEEKNYTGAADIYKTILADPKLGQFRLFKATFGAARAAYGMKNIPDAKTHYRSLFEQITAQDKIADPRQTKMSPAEIAEYRWLRAGWWQESKAKIEELNTKP